MLADVKWGKRADQKVKEVVWRAELVPDHPGAVGGNGGSHMGPRGQACPASCRPGHSMATSPSLTGYTTSCTLAWACSQRWVPGRWPHGTIRTSGTHHRDQQVAKIKRSSSELQTRDSEGPWKQMEPMALKEDKWCLPEFQERREGLANITKQASKFNMEQRISKQSQFTSATCTLRQPLCLWGAHLRGPQNPWELGLGKWAALPLRA